MGRKGRKGRKGQDVQERATEPVLRETRKLDALLRVCAHPEVLPFVMPSEFRVPTREAMERMVKDRRNLVLIADGDRGFVVLRQKSEEHYEAHIGFVPGSRGRYAAAVMRGAAEWLFGTRPVAKKVETRFPAWRRDIKWIAASVGCTIGRLGREAVATLRRRDFVCQSVQG